MDIDVKKIAKLARLKLSEDEAPKYQREMENMLLMVQNLPEIDDVYQSVDPNHPMILRDDIIQPSLPRDELLQNAKEVMAGCVVVPKTVE